MSNQWLFWLSCENVDYPVKQYIAFLILTYWYKKFYLKTTTL
jgi:hypothetical protein